MTILTPTLRESAKRSRFWVAAVAFAIIVAVIVMAGTGASGPGGPPLSGTNPGPVGSMAIVEVLRQQGVTVTMADTLGEAREALDGPQSTLMLHDANQLLDADQLSDIGRIAGHTVLVDPGFRQLRELVPSVSAAGTVTGTLQADCALTAVTRAGTVLGDGSGYRQIDDTADGELCLGSDDGYSLIQTSVDGRLITVLGTTEALTNEHLAERGNAALALNLFGEHPTLVWYQPTPADVTRVPTIGELTPAWLSMVMVLLFLVVIAAGIWRGRRMGPLVVENLPVTVPSSETMEGRARLYQKTRARLRAIDSLRVGTISRLAVLCGLPHTATVDEVIGVTAALTGADAGRLRALLIDSVPANDDQLVRMSDELLTIEWAAAEATRPA